MQHGTTIKKRINIPKRNSTKDTVQTIRNTINIPKRNSTKDTVQTIRNTINTSAHITKTPTHTHTHVLQNKLKQPQCKLTQTQYKRDPSEIVAV